MNESNLSNIICLSEYRSLPPSGHARAPYDVTVTAHLWRRSGRIFKMEFQVDFGSDDGGWAEAVHSGEDFGEAVKAAIAFEADEVEFRLAVELDETPV